VFALRMANDKDQAIVQSAVADTGSGLLEFLPSLGQREAIAFGDGMSLPVRIKFDELPKHCLPRSSTARFSEKWQKSMGDEGFLEQVVDRWRMSGIGNGGDMASQLAMMADAVGLTGNSDVTDGDMPYAESAAPRLSTGGAQNYPSQAGGARPSAPLMRKDASSNPAGGFASRLGGSSAPPPMGIERRQPVASVAEAPAAAPASSSLRSLRDRLTRPAGQ
jgi:uncharacterized protein